MTRIESMLRHRFSVALLWIGTLIHSTLFACEPWVRIEVSRDTWVSNYPSEQTGSNGRAAKLKLKSIIELSMIDFPIEKLDGREVLAAKLLLKVAGDRPIERVTLSTITADWVEGDGENYAVVQGASSFSHRIYPEERWYGSDLTAVALGNGNSFYSSQEPRAAAMPGWVELDVPPEILLARIHGFSFGMLLMDDCGSTWTRNGEDFQQEIFPNRFVSSRDSNRSSAPYLMVQLADVDQSSLEGRIIPHPQELQFLAPDADDPRPRIQWQLKTEALEELLGFRVTINNRRIEPFWVPSIRSHQHGRFTMPLDRLQDMLGGGAPNKFELVAIARSGRESTSVECDIQAPELVASPIPLKPLSTPSRSASGKAFWDGALKGDDARWAVIDPLDTYIAATEQWVPPQRSSYFLENHLWDAKRSVVTLDTARDGWSGFQLVCDQEAEPAFEWTWQMEDVPLSTVQQCLVEFSTYRGVSGNGQSIPDPLVPIEIKREFPRIHAKPGNSARSSSWLIEIYTPGEVPAGEYQAILRVDSVHGAIPLRINLRVHNVVIPKALSFLPEMNCYGLPPNELDYYRLAQRNRTFLNRVPYSQNGSVTEGCSPVWENGQLHWESFDRRFSSLFTGQAFVDLPRGAVPIECFYLPMHENWPLPMETNYNGSYWADQAFPAEYREAWVASVRQSAEHLAQQGWLETRFHVYLNNKNNFKARGWSRGSSPWLLDEPANFQDFLALRYFGLAFREGMLQARMPLGDAKVPLERRPKVVFRADISRPQWQRDTLDEMLHYNVVAQGAFREYAPLVLDRKFRFAQEVIVYGSSNPIGSNNAMAVAWSWDAWCGGADGVLPWQTIGNSASWEKADELSLFYPAPDGQLSPPIPSVRLKAFCYGQQDVEVLIQLAKKSGIDRYRFGQLLRDSLEFRGVDRAEGDQTEPATWSDYGNLTPEMLHAWRVQLLRLCAGNQ